MQQRVVANRYALVAELGRGGMGVVWRARDQVLGREIAIKELFLPQGARGEEARVMEERMLREARTAGRLSHSGVVTVHDVIVEGERTFLTMEFVDAPDLAAIVAGHGARDSVWVANVALQALGALESAHAAGIVHRDVKPSNILVRPDGVVKLTDFGIAQARDDPRLTTDGGIMGSPAYISPDRLHGWEASPASDLWALGVTMAHAVEGVSPFERTSTASTLHAIMNEPPTLTLASPALADVIRGLLTVDPAKRLTAAQARAKLTAITQDQPRGTGTRRGPGTRVRAALAVAAVAVVAGAVLGGYQLWSAPAAVSQATPAAGAGSPAPGTPASEPVGTMLPPGRVATFGRNGAVPVWNLSGTQCAKDFLTQGAPVDGPVPCTGPHSIQLFGAATPLWDKPQPVAYPGEGWLADFATQYCTDHFQTTNAHAKNTLAFVALIPTHNEWDAHDDPVRPGHQEILCIAWNHDRAPLTGSVVS